MAVSVLRLLKSVLLVIFVYSFNQCVLSETVCSENKYFQRILHTCLPCEDVCVPLNRSDCRRLCPDFYRRHTTCRWDQYWERLRGKCFNCSEICEPVTRLDCIDRCHDYIVSLKTSTTSQPTITTTGQPKHTGGKASKTTEDRIDGQSSVILIVVLSVFIVITMTCGGLIAVIYWRRNNKVGKPDKAPIQDTNPPDSSNSLLEDAQQNLESGQECPV